MNRLINKGKKTIACTTTELSTKSFFKIYFIYEAIPCDIAIRLVNRAMYL